MREPTAWCSVAARQQQELGEFLHTLSPELGTLECCRRALAELVRVRQLSGAAIILRDGEAVVHGTFNLELLLRVWPRGAAADALPAESFGAAELRELPLTLRERVERQVAALLRFARREEFRFEPVDIGVLARGVVEEFGQRLAAAGVAIEVDCADGVVARADREKLRQVLINLIENALDALSGIAGRRHLALRVTSANGTASLRVADSGAGVPGDALPRLFEPFFSLKEKGTGLGLAIARRTVEAHGGRIAATSGEGGTAFEIELPAAGS